MALNGNEILYVLGQDGTGAPAATTLQTTTGAIAALGGGGGSDGPVINTAITTVGNGTLTAAAISGGVITRTGPVAAYTDTTDTAAAIVASITDAFVGQSFFVRIKNGVAFGQTLSAGSGVTFTGASIVIPANSVGTYLVTLTSLTAVSMLHIETVPLSNNTPESITTLSTVGAGTITGAGIAGGVVSRTGSQSNTAFTDTTDTAANIIAAQNNAHIGMTWEFLYINTTNAPATIAGGTGVTPSGITVIPAGISVRYLVTYTAAATITMVALSATQSAVALSSSSLVLQGATSGTATVSASAVSGSSSLTLPAVTGTVASTSGSNLLIADITRCTSAQTANATTTYASITGLSQTVAVGTYRFRCVLPSTVASGTGGIKYAFHYTTTVLSALEATGMGYTASAVAVQHTTSTSDVADLFSQAAVVIMTIIEGTMTVSTGGTIALQMAQNTSNASNSITLLGASMEFDRIA